MLHRFSRGLVQASAVIGYFEVSSQMKICGPHSSVILSAFAHTDLFTQRCPYTQTLSHTDTFTHRRFYTQTLLHTDTFTPLLHTEAFTHRRFYTQRLLHAKVYTQTVLHTNTFTQRRFYTQKLLHTDAITHTWKTWCPLKMGYHVTVPGFRLENCHCCLELFHHRSHDVPRCITTHPK